MNSLIKLLWVFRNGLLERNFCAAGISPNLNAVARYRRGCRPDHEACSLHTVEHLIYGQKDDSNFNLTRIVSVMASKGCS